MVGCNGEKWIGVSNFWGKIKLGDSSNLVWMGQRERAF